VNGPAALAGAPWTGLSAEFREAILASTPRADVKLIGRACYTHGDGTGGASGLSRA